MYVEEIYATGVITAGYNLATGREWAKYSRPVRVHRIGVVGGTAIGDLVVKIKYGSRDVGEFMNTSVADLMHKNFQWVNPSQLYCKAGERINLEALQAGAGQYLLAMDVQEVNTY